VACLVAEQHCAAVAAEEAVGDEHGLVIPAVVVVRAAGHRTAHDRGG
jgi:hypothetical protein